MKKTKYFLKVTTALMFVAFAWGFIDFVKADGRGVFKTLYHPQKNMVVAVKDSFNEIKAEDFSRKAFTESIDPPAIKQSKSVIETDTPNVDSIKMSETIMQKLDKKAIKKLSYRSFSRGSLDLPTPKMPLEIIDSLIHTDTITNNE